MRDNELPHVSASGFLNHVAACQAAGVNAGILGNPGIGKTAILEQVANNSGAHYASYSASGLAPDQVRGFMMPGVDGTTVFQKPAILDLPAEGKSLLAIDEVNSISNEMFAAFFELFGSRRIGEYAVPDECFLVGTGNLLTNRGVARPMPTPFSNRFSWVIYTGPTFDEWMDHMGDNCNPLIEAFLARDKAYLCGHFNAKDNLNPTPRSWDYASKLLNANPQCNADQRMTLISSCVGMKAATMMGGLNKYLDKLPTLEEIEAEPMKTRVPDIEEEGGMQAQYYLASVMSRTLAGLKDESFDSRQGITEAFTAYSLRFEKEILFSYYTRVARNYAQETGFKTMSHILNQEFEGQKVRDGHVGEMISRIAGSR